jgi:hypothetical protein
MGPRARGLAFVVANHSRALMSQSSKVVPQVGPCHSGGGPALAPRAPDLHHCLHDDGPVVLNESPAVAGTAEKGGTIVPQNSQLVGLMD